MSKYRLSDDCVFDPSKHKMTPEEEKAFDENFDANYEAFCETAVRTGSYKATLLISYKGRKPTSEIFIPPADIRGVLPVPVTRQLYSAQTPDMPAATLETLFLKFLYCHDIAS